MSSEKRDPKSNDGQTGNKSDDTKQPSEKQQSKAEKKDKPPGGYDESRIPHSPPGYTVKVTFHRATHLPIADLSTLSSDPFLKAEITTDLRPRHKEDPVLMFRTRTVWKSTHPEWNQEWVLEHVPASGFKMKVRVYDEDSSDKDDRLGNVHISVGRIDEQWKGIHDEGYKIKKKTGSKRAYLLRAIAVCMGRLKEMNGNLYVSIEVLGRSKGDEGGRTFTTGRNYWIKHRSPLLGRLTGNRDPNDESESEDDSGETGQDEEHGDSSQKSDFISRHSRLTKTGKPHNQGDKKKAGKYNFQANQFQLRGPVPPELYHRYVEFRPIISTLFTSKGLRGLIMNKALTMQHDRVYAFNRQTEYGEFAEPCEDMTRKFLELVHHDEGGRIFTYVILLDGLMRFSETGKEFGIDLLSKHTMHSDASIYIAFSGEFFIRRLKHANRDPPEMAEAKASHSKQDRETNNTNKKQKDKEKDSSPTKDRNAAAETQNESHPPKQVPGGPPKRPPPHDPAYYEIIIDNDSGTYRPNSAMFPHLRRFLESNFPKLKIVTLDCNADKELMERLKGEQRAIKKAEGSKKKYTQVDDASSLSSEDVETMQKKAGSGKEGDDGDEEGGAKHQLGEALGPLIGNHSTARKIVGAEKR